MKQTFFDIGKRLLAELDIEKLLTNIMDIAIEKSGAERGMIILFDSSGQILFETARHLNKEDITQPEFEISRTIIDKVKNENTALCLRNALAEPYLQKSKSVARLKILSIICFPLKYDNTLFGVLYLDNRTVRGVFEPETCSFFVEQFAEFISLVAYQALERKKLSQQVDELEQALRDKYQFESIIGHAPKMIEILKLVAQVADTDATVLIQGESGTGKELIARALHYNSRRKNQPFVAINCAALPDNLLESELFGHLRGSFTGAIKDKAGWFEAANNGTIFLDEISELPLHLQVKLLRILQTGEYSRVGSTEICYSNARVITAASRDLQKLVQEQKFREEFYYRLNVIDIWLPPLRERQCDILLLAHYFLKKYATKYGKENLKLSKKVETLLQAYQFPGNVRELENILQRAVVLAEGAEISPEHLPENVRQHTKIKIENDPLSPFKIAKEMAITTFEKEYIVNCLKIAKGNISQAARMAGINQKNLHSKMKKYRINPYSFK